MYQAAANTPVERSTKKDLMMPSRNFLRVIDAGNRAEESGSYRLRRPYSPRLRALWKGLPILK
jgi:hypothetical protein